MHPYIPDRHSSNLEQRFLAKVRVLDTFGCWEWQGCLSSGYGRVSSGDERGTIYAHRLSIEMESGPLEEGVYACHRCDNRCCVNPSCLFRGTHEDNLRDMASKGRGRKPMPGGYKAGSLSLTIARQIRSDLAAGKSGRSLAIRHGVSTATISNVKNDKAWSESNV